MRAGDGGEAFREAMEIAIFPRIEAFSPDVVVISAGFDAPPPRFAWQPQSD